MALIEWSDTLAVGIRSIDEQHKQLIAIINELHDAMMARQSRAILGQIFERLKAYTHYHFEEEERLFREYGYPDPDAERHLAEHAKLTKKVLELEAAFGQSEASISMDLMDFLRDWLREHLMGSDKKYVPFLVSKGVT